MLTSATQLLTPEIFLPVIVLFLCSLAHVEREWHHWTRIAESVIFL